MLFRRGHASLYIGTDFHYYHGIHSDTADFDQGQADEKTEASHCDPLADFDIYTDLDRDPEAGHFPITQVHLNPYLIKW